MLWRDNRGENPSAEEKETQVNGQNTTVKKAFSDVQDLKAKIEELKAKTEKIADSRPEGGGSVSDEPKSPGSTGAAGSEIDSEEVRAAELAVLQQARKDAEERQAVYEDRMEKTARIKVAQIRQKEAREKLLQKQKEAVEKRKALKEAEAREAEIKKQRQKAELRAELNRTERSRIHAEALEKRTNSEQKLKDIKLQKERIEQERLKREALIKAREERERQEALRRREEEEKRRILEEKRREEEARKAREHARREAERLKAAEEARLARVQKKKEAAEKRYEKQHRKAERERLIEEQRAIQRNKREAARAEANKIREENRARKAAEKKVRKEQLKAERAKRNELRKKKKFARKAADMGGGIVAVHGTTVQTEIQPVPAFSLLDLLGISKRKEIKNAAYSDEQREKLVKESERIKSEARATAAKLAEARRERRKNTALYKRCMRVHDFCVAKSKPILIAFSVILMVIVGTAGVYNYFTAYEYAYNGISLGYVRNKDDVLQITEMVQTALSEERQMNVVIDAEDDISFRRVSTFNKDTVIDSQEEILKRLTYMGDVNIKSYGIYINGKKAGAVSSKESAADVLEEMKNKYASNKEGAKIEKAEIVEDIAIKSCKTPMKDVMSEEEMVEKLSTDSVKEVVYTIERGDTLESIAENHGVTPEEIEKDNANVDVNTLPVGSTIILHEVSPIMTVRITEVRTYEKKTDYKTIKKEDKDLYEGYTEVDQKGEKGVSEVVDRTLSINGEIVETDNLKTDVKKEPVEKIVRVGTKERPPTVGSGTYIWPAYSGTYVVTSEFKWRWGRQHQGIDMGCSTGNDVLASDGGTVIHAGWMGGYGNLVIIDHQNGVQTYYAHNSSLCVSVGDKVFQGQHIAEAGNTGNSFGSHIHFGVKDHGVFKNPRNYLP